MVERQGCFCDGNEGSRRLASAVLDTTICFRARQFLHTVAVGLQPWGSLAMIYLAAAVSDFYVPWDTMVTCNVSSTSAITALRSLF